MEVNNKMQRGAFFCLWILFTFSLFAQNEENGSATCASVVHKNTFGKVLKRFLDFSDFDTTYICLLYTSQINIRAKSAIKGAKCDITLLIY